MADDLQTAPFSLEEFTKEPGPRPDIIDLIGPRFDRPAVEPADRTLIICGAPRTGSYELARLLMGAGIGIAHEYFNPNYAPILASRWGLAPSALLASEIDNYVMELRCRRGAGGVFATKLQYWQYRQSLCNNHGRILFNNATVVHLFRADVVRQLISWLRAMETGRYDFSDRGTRPPRDPTALLDTRNLLEMVNFLAAGDAGFRKLFMLAGIRPILIEFEQLIKDPRAAVDRIVHVLQVPVNYEGLDKALDLSGPYRREDRDEAVRERAVESILAKMAFNPLAVAL